MSRWLCDPPVTWEPPPPPHPNVSAKYLDQINLSLSLSYKPKTVVIQSFLSKAVSHWRQSRSHSGERSRTSTYDLVKIKNRSHKCSRIGVRRIRTFPFLPTALTTLSLTFRLWSSENQIVGVGSRSRRINQPQCMFPCFGLVPLLLLPTPTIW